MKVLSLMVLLLARAYAAVGQTTEAHITVIHLIFFKLCKPKKLWGIMVAIGEDAHGEFITAAGNALRTNAHTGMKKPVRAFIL